MRKQGVLVAAALCLSFPSPALPEPDSDKQAAVSHSSNDAPGDLAHDKLEAVKKALPQLVAAWAKSSDGTALPVALKVRLARRTGVSDAKLTLQLEDSFADPPSLLTIQLVYYGGSWTTVHYGAALRGMLAGRENRLPELMLAIDTVNGK